ncbi:carbohydrate kinase family protein [Nakamurella deserti]|uniref:carbohydrate kinase family protein n=1 Tax=Nakamurella deserti TaxID=2164074 RepID=UPI00197B780E|nr:PfkB family carbohydrate kinase [Nakamurella deserti]
MSPLGGPSRPQVFVAGPVAWNLLIRVPELPPARPHAVTARSYRHTLGGTSAGKTLNLARLGAAVTLRTVVGDDPEAQWALAPLRAAGATVIAEIDPAGRTEQHVNLMSDDGERVSVHLTRPELVETLHSGQTAAAFAAADAVVLDPADSSRPFIAQLTGRDVPVWVDLHSHDGRDRSRDDFAAVATHLVFSGERFPEPAGYMRARIDAGARLVVCTRGADGALALDAHGRWHDVPAVPVPEIVDSNGAGDAFTAAALLALLDGADAATALRAAAAHAARCVRSDELAPPQRPLSGGA